MHIEPGPRRSWRIGLDREAEVLSRWACLALLAGTDRGRIALSVGALPTIVPVRFVVDPEERIVVTSPSTDLVRAADGHVVAFQADGREARSSSEWSVVVVGPAVAVDGGPSSPSPVVVIPTGRLHGHRTMADP